jgi:hypothetical protein
LGNGNVEGLGGGRKLLRWTRNRWISGKQVVRMGGGLKQLRLLSDFGIGTSGSATRDLDT